MKNKYLVIVILLAITGMFTIQSCVKDESPTPVIYKAAVITNPTPAVGDVLPQSGTSYTLKWEGTTSTTWDVYFGPAGNVALYKSGVSGNSLTVTVADGGAFEWYVRTKDANGIVSSNITGPARDPWYFYINTAPTAPTLDSPVDGATDVDVTGSLDWTSDDAEGDDITYDVYFGTSPTPALVASGLTDPTYSPTMAASTVYYWKVVATDSHGYTSESATHSFTSGLEAIMAFTGAYTCDEPAEAWTYPVNFSKKTSSSLTIDAWWYSWPATFTLDLVAGTYSMAKTTFTSGYVGVEQGAIIDAATGEMQGTYTIWHNGAVIEQGVHTYTKNKK
jgi:hypothetical protein